MRAMHSAGWGPEFPNAKGNGGSKTTAPKKTAIHRSGPAKIQRLAIRTSGTRLAASTDTLDSAEAASAASAANAPNAAPRESDFAEITRKLRPHEYLNARMQTRDRTGTEPVQRMRTRSRLERCSGNWA